ncbi:MAG: bifunctional YncE family protein/alkaline phosphatase family protein [Gemmatimonadota bacterium]|nr:bifunctional YncE family protein/alkaline phosphatase family protein [Gemmatimonadota bacterium]
MEHTLFDQPTMRPHRSLSRVLAGGAIAALLSCRPAAVPSVQAPEAPAVAAAPAPAALSPTIGRLPTGLHLDPAAPQHPTASFPLGMAVSPDGRRIAMSMDGWLRQGVQIVDRATGAVTQTLEQPAAFIGIAFSPDGRMLYASGGNQDVVYRYEWRGDTAALRDSIVLAAKRPRAPGRRYPAGLAFSADGRRLFVAENMADSLAVVDVASGKVIQRYGTDAYPYGVVVAPSGTVYVSAWGGYTVSEFTPQGDRYAARRIGVGRHPSAMALNASGSRLYVASGSTDRVMVLNTSERRVVQTLSDAPPAGPGEGSTPNALALSADGRRLYVAEADANAVAAFDLSAGTADAPGAAGRDTLAGRIPTGWYPSLVAVVGDSLFVATSKGMGTRANPNGPWPILTADHTRGANYTLGQLQGSVMFVPLAELSGASLASLTARTARADGWDRPTERAGAYPPFTHVIYIIKENRTYDEVFGDMASGDGDTALVFFPRADSPNHHALADRFGLFDRFFVNAEVSADGHNWSTAAYATDYLEKTVQSQYSDRGRPYEYEGSVFGGGVKSHIPKDDAAQPASGYLWDLAERKGITFRNYGEFVVPSEMDPDDPMPPGYRGDKPFLKTHTDPDYPGFDLAIRDQHRVDEWSKEFDRYVKGNDLPALEIVRLPDDHTSGAQAGMPTPRAAMADNDLALGRIVQAVSHSPFWKNTVIFVLEDDAQNGPDHVDSHRSPMLVISAYNRPGTIHRWTNTTDVLRTIEEILGLQSMSQFDYYGRPLRDIWAAAPDLTPYTALVPSVSLDDTNPSAGRGARESRKLDLEIEDMSNPDLFNHILWRALKGTAPYPGAKRVSGWEAKVGN